MKQRQSLRYRLAIAIAGIAGAVVISFGLVVYREMRNATLEAAGTRLRGVTTQLATMLATSAPAVRATVAGAAADSAVVSYLRDPSAKSAAAARSAMARSSTSAGAVSGVELLDLLGRRVLTTAQPWPEMAGPEGQSLTSLVAARDSVAIGWIGAARDTTAMAEVPMMRFIA